MMDWNTEIREGVLSCPVCHDENGTHVDRVHVLVSHDDGDQADYLSVGPDGMVTLEGRETHPDAFGNVGRRHEFALVGWCELCGGNWALIFRQHKGQTLVKVMTEGVLPGERQ